ncbi:hypothetical protein HPB48_023763 [Haemaphysalis longicornis]|uniref:C2H2-type domain-containing protein n=1 Tax=Haemaphysalis longicornis TaxID=44386 RepID=A0A9J6H7D9_HAELO|nr:hypothetical protein HPB48_023763 [Haemaphysalis longicornis]
MTGGERAPTWREMSSDDIDLRQFPMADWRSGHGASEDHKSATSDGSRKNHDNPGINAPRPPKSSARLVAVGLTSRRDMPEGQPPYQPYRVPQGPTRALSQQPPYQPYRNPQGPRQAAPAAMGQGPAARGPRPGILKKPAPKLQQQPIRYPGPSLPSWRYTAPRTQVTFTLPPTQQQPMLENSGDVGDLMAACSVLQGAEVLLEEEARIQCPHCDYNCRNRAYLRRHIRVHTGERPYHCTFCPSKFKDRSNLNRHRRCHTGERPYECSHCGARFNQTSSLKTHVLGQHR